MKRICIIGCGGAGKTTLSQTLSKQSNLRLIHLDTLFWTANWVQEEQVIFEQKLSMYLANDTWIMDGNFLNTMPMRFQRADTIIWLDYPTWRCLYGILKRLITDYGCTRSDMASGCKESFDWNFLLYVISFRRKRRKEILRILNEHAKHCEILVFKNPSDIKNVWRHK